MKHVFLFTRFKSAVLLLMLFVALSHAEEKKVSPPPIRSLTVSDLVSMALRENPLLHSQEARIEEKTLAGKQFKKWPGPSIGFATGRRKDPTQSGPLYNADVSQPLPLFGKQAHRGDLSLLESDSWRTRLDASENQITLEVLELAFDVAMKSREAEFVKKRQKRLTLIKSFLEGRLFASPQKKAESRIVQGRLKILTSDALQSQAGLRSSIARLGSYVPIAPGASLDVHVPWFSGGKDLHQTEWTGKALAMNPDLRQQMNSVKSAEKEKRLATTEKWPDPALTASYEKGEATETETNSTIGLNLSFPFWNGNRTGVKSAEKRQAAEEKMLSAQERIIKSQTLAALAEYEAARRAVQEYPEALLEELQTQMGEAETSFRKGQVDLLTFLELDDATADTYRHVLESQLMLAVRAADIFRLSGERDILSQLETF